MRYKWLLFLPAILLIFAFTLGNSQVQTVRIIVKGVSTDLKALGRFDALSSGLSNVGKGQKVWLEALALYSPEGEIRDSYIDTILTEEWSIVGPPGSSVTEPVRADTTLFFVPDTTGQYQINLMVTTNNGTVDTSIYINSAKWVGVGNMTGSPEISKGECASCHSGKTSEWQGTSHATAFARKIDDAAGHFGDRCLSCHTVGHDILSTAVNNGFDDIQTASAWTFPATLQPGNWDSMKTHYADLAEKATIQCENCHGPGSLHYGAKDKNQIDVSFSSDVCGQCHGAAPKHAKNYEWEQSRHAHSVGEPGEIEHMNSSSCTQCHTAQGFVYQTIGGAAAAAYEGVQPISCSACHDPHSDENPSQLRVTQSGDACTGCHKTRISSRGLHHSPQGPMLAGADGTPFTLGQSGVGNWGGFQFAGYGYRNSSHSNITEKCVGCHMANIEGADTALIPAPYSQYQSKLGGHTFRVAWDNDTPDDGGDDLLNPVGCKECHGNVSLEFVEQSQEKIKDLLEELRVLLPHATSGDTTQPLVHTSSSLTTVQKAASYNYYFVSYDGSYGVHNYEYASALLRSSIEMVKLGSGAASIASITDIPNDQGKQVQIVWNKFPAEHDPVAPVTTYLVLREDEINSLAKGSATVAVSYRDMLSKIRDASHATLSGSIWTKVGEYEAIKQPMYSLNVPTLFDSTAFDGVQLSTFVVIGYTGNTVVYSSLPASGYSIDNLAPASPTGFTAIGGGGVATLVWDNSNDADFKYVAVYRGITPNFNPQGTPLATTSGTRYTDDGVQSGRVYYYKLTAFDFSGNESNFTEEKSLLVTDASDEKDVPAEYSLQQNHPNPFNPSTTVRYSVPHAAHVRIEIYNSLGMRVKTLVDQTENAGHHQIEWNGTDDSGNPVSTGIYLCKMEAGSYNSLKKMLFIK